jgi:hypothetical protein
VFSETRIRGTCVIVAEGTGVPVGVGAGVLVAGASVAVATSIGLSGMGAAGGACPCRQEANRKVAAVTATMLNM